MELTIDVSTTIDVSLDKPLTLLRAIRNGDTERLSDAVDVLDFEYEVSR